MVQGDLAEKASLSRHIREIGIRRIQGWKKVQLSNDYDVFIAVCSTYWDLPNINAIEHWRKRSKISICWIEEIWVNEITKYKYWHGALSQFDYVFIGLKGSVSALSQAVNRTCYWLPGGVDALQFSPFPTHQPALLTCTVSDVGTKSSTAKCSRQSNEASFSMCMVRIAQVLVTLK